MLPTHDYDLGFVSDSLILSPTFDYANGTFDVIFVACHSMLFFVTVPLLAG